MGGGDFKHWTHISDGKFVIKTNTFTQLFFVDGPTADQLFFLNFVSSPLYCHLISPLFFVLSFMSQNSPKLSPQKYWTHPPLITLTRPAIISLLSSLYLSFRSHPPLITLNRSPTSHNSHQTNNFLLCTLISKGPKPKYTKKITRPTSISLTHLTPHRSSLINPNSGFKRVKIPHDLSPITPINHSNPFLPINSSPTKLCC